MLRSMAGVVIAPEYTRVRSRPRLGKGLYVLELYSELFLLTLRGCRYIGVEVSFVSLQSFKNHERIPASMPRMSQNTLVVEHLIR